MENIPSIMILTLIEKISEDGFLFSELLEVNLMPADQTIDNLLYLLLIEDFIQLSL